MRPQKAIEERLERVQGSLAWYRKRKAEHPPEALYCGKAWHEDTQHAIDILVAQKRVLLWILNQS